MTEIHGVTGAPYKTPQVRKKIPAPHARQRIDLDGGRAVKRSWKDTSVLDVKVGDIVASIGRIEATKEIIVIPAVGDDGDVSWVVQLTNVAGDRVDLFGHQRVYAFTPDKDQP